MKPMSARQLGRLLGISGSAVLKLYRDGVIDAVVSEGTLIRFDAEAVKQRLAERADANRKQVNPLDGMVPTY